MKRFLLLSTLLATTSVFAADIGVSVSIGQPGFYGRIDIGNYPQPQVVNPQPVMIEPIQVNRPPIYLRVPPGHIKHWKKHCHEYNACGERVFFVKDDWYTRDYAPRYQEQQRARGDERRGERHDDHRGERGHDRHDDDHEHGRDR